MASLEPSRRRGWDDGISKNPVKAVTKWDPRGRRACREESLGTLVGEGGQDQRSTGGRVRRNDPEAAGKLEESHGPETK